MSLTKVSLIALTLIILLVSVSPVSALGGIRQEVPDRCLEEVCEPCYSLHHLKDSEVSRLTETGTSAALQACLIELYPTNDAVKDLS